MRNNKDVEGFPLKLAVGVRDVPALNENRRRGE